MRVSDGRRLTGPNLLLPGPGAAVEWRFDAGDDRAGLLARWGAFCDAVLPSLGLGGERRAAREHDEGASLAVAGPIDRLYALVALLEWASEALAAGEIPSVVEAIARYAAALDEEPNGAPAPDLAPADRVLAAPNPRLLALERAARARGVPLLWDDDEVSLGHGARCQRWATTALPAPEAVDWEACGAIPVALITGTNGKTTTSRMLTRILRRAGHHVGTSSTDGLTRDEVMVEAGDWTGPGAARQVLRRPDVDVAVLETARGGLLRRGLGVDSADVAVVTNIGDDHLGDYGITTLEAMAAVKAIVWSAVRPGGRRVANAEDPRLVVLAERWPTEERVYFALDADHPVIAAHVARGGEAWVAREGALVRLSRLSAGAATPVVPVVPIAAIPATIGGAAGHNVQNALAAAAAAAALGVSDEAIAAGLVSFGAEPRDNPGRLERHAVPGGARVVLDFGHNPHGVRAVSSAVAGLRGEVAGSRLAVSIGQAGDRSDRDLRGLAAEVAALDPDRVWVRPLPGYERGRSMAEVMAVLTEGLVARGLDPSRVTEAAGEVAYLEQAVAWARPGDLVLMLVHVEREAVRAWLAAR